MAPDHYWQEWFRFRAKADDAVNDAYLREGYMAVADAYEWLAQSITRALNEQVLAAQVQARLPA